MWCFESLDRLAASLVHEGCISPCIFVHRSHINFTSLRIAPNTRDVRFFLASILSYTRRLNHLASSHARTQQGPHPI